jgi:hypothetical protein
MELENLNFKKNLTYKQYLDSPIVFLNDGISKVPNISVKNLIKRISNEFGPSHKYAEEEYKHITFKDSIDYLFKFSHRKIRLPYFLLLIIAKDILNQAPKIILKKTYQLNVSSGWLI